MIKFLIKASVLMILLLLSTYLLRHFAFQNNNEKLLLAFSNFAYYSIIFFFFITISIVYISYNSITKNNHRQFSTIIMAGMTLKLLAAAIFVLLYAAFSKPISILIVVPFFIYYIAFTTIEIAEFLRLNKQVSISK